MDSFRTDTRHIEIADELTRDDSRRVERAVPAEVPAALVYNGLSHAVMMITPADVEDFAVGFTLGEGIVASANDITDVNVRPVEDGLLVEMTIPEDAYKALIGNRRNTVGQTGCGLCGIEELGNVLRDYEPVGRPVVEGRAALFRAVDDLADHQPMNRETGAVHAAALADAAGRIGPVREDVGRHNALDKLLGHLAREGRTVEEGFVMLSSRCSFELVQKALAARVPMLAAISAPTMLAVELAKRYRLTLISLARSDSVLVFNDPYGLIGDP